MKRIKASSIATAAFLVVAATTGAGIYQAERATYLSEQHAPPQQYETDVDAWAQQGVPAQAVRQVTSRDGDAFTFGPKTGTKTLVLYGTGGRYAEQAEASATAAAQLASHFGPVTTLPLRDYTPGMLEKYDAMLYVGVMYEPRMPDGLVDDIVGGDTPVVWAGQNVATLAGVTEKGGSTAARDRFVRRYGWDAAASRTSSGETLTKVVYKGTDLERAKAHDQDALTVPHIVDRARATVLAEVACEKSCRSADRISTSTLPWAVRSENLTFVVESPFSFPVEDGHQIAYADLLYAALGPDVEPVRQAAVRLEDVSPISDPDRIRMYADYLHGEGVPFQIAVVPNFVDRAGVTLSGRPRNLTLADTPEVVEALKYARSKGGTLVQHGTTHQFAEVPNPYGGATGDDFEFYRAACTTSPGSGSYIPCETNTEVELIGPIGEDDPAATASRVAGGRALFGQAGLDTPMIFETPHYAASANAYEGMRRVYDTRYERAQYAAGVLTGRPESGRAYDQIFPYRVTDVHGSRILPENLGSVAPQSYSGHEVRSPEQIVESARKNLVVRESTASFFYHPFLPIEGLQQIVAGIKAQGYTFVKASELR